MECTHGTWGDRIRTFRWDGGLTTILYLAPGQRCSWHSHKSTWNQFFVVSGCLGVKTDKGYTTKITERQSFTVEPGVFHEFMTYDEPTIIEEIAYVKYEEADIHRQRLGGPVEAPVDVSEHKEYLLGDCRWQSQK